MNLDRYLTYTEAGEILGLTPATVREYCQQGRLDREYPFSKRAPFVTRASVERYAAERRPVGQPKKV